MKETILSILEDMRPDVDFQKNTALVDDGILESFDIITLVSELMSEFGVSVSAKELVAKNFNSAESICQMVERLKGEQDG